jgi:hypothetical protein
MENYNKIEKEDWATYYYLNDELHRLDGPAIEYHYGEGKEWYQNGQLHRVSGPAIEYCNKYKEWWIEGKQIDCNSQEEFERYLKLRLFW